jgi:hypothetical protein
MKPFENKTNTGNEPAVKKGTFLPSDSVNIGYFSSEKITPEKHLSVIDFSTLIPENTSVQFSSEVDTMMYADEFGVLRYLRNNSEAGQIAGSPIVHNSEVSISNNIMNFTEEEIDYNFTGRENEFESNFFVHSYYVSTDFVLLDSRVAEYEGIENSSELINPLRYNIKVVDQSGSIDPSIRYKILLEKYTNNNLNAPIAGSIYQSLDLYRIIVLLEKYDPQNLYLIYDRYEKDEENIPFNPFFGYKEKINTVPYYNYVVEESEVVDYSSLNKKVYSTQLFSYKENELLETRINNDGWKIFTPRKAIQDPRTFQSFNWRLISKINYDFSQTRNVYSDSERPIIKTAVLHSGPLSEAKNVYVFNNMQESVFNLQNYIFINPYANPSFSSIQKGYWIVDIDRTDNQYTDYDLLIWTPTRAVTDLQAGEVERILNQNISVFIDMSNLDDSSIATSVQKFSFTGISVSSVSSGALTIRGDYSNADTTMQAWSLSEFVETTNDIKEYNIFGKRKDILNNNSQVPVRCLVGEIANPSSSLVTMGANNNVFIKRSSGSSALYPSSLVVTAVPFLQIINDIFSADGTQGLNNGDTNIFPLGTIGSQRVNNISRIVVGPNKFFYNIISDINKVKVNKYAFDNTTNNSTVLWNVSPWRNSWTINGQNVNNQVTVLSEMEKQEFNFGFKQETGSSESLFCRQISSSLTNLFRADFENTLNGGDAANIVNQDFSNVEFYIESTNPNVRFLDFVNINQEIISGQESLFGQQSLRYQMFKLKQDARPLVRDGSLSIDALSNVISSELNTDYGYPFVIANTSQYQERDGTSVRTPSDFIPGSQDSAEYSFDLKTQISINQITKTINSYRVNWSTPFSSIVGGTGDFSGYLMESARIDGALAKTNYSVAQEPENKIKIDKSFSPFNDYPYPSRVFSRVDIRSVDQKVTSSSQNNFHYTGDIDEGNRWDEYFFGKDTVATTSTRITKGNLIPQIVIREAIESFNLSLISGYPKLLLSFGVWDDDVYVSSTSLSTFKKYFNIWLEGFLLSIFQNANAVTLQRRGYLSTVSRAFIANKFIEQNPGLSYATEDLAPTSGSSLAGINGYSADYVKYIQYTLLKMNYNQEVNGIYDKSTGKNIRTFQRRKSLGFVDGIVDSQTKSVLAIYWLNLYKNNIEKYNSERDGAPSGSRKYISAAVKYSDIANIGEPGKEYRRLSFTGVPGPTEISDYLICKVPQVSSVDQKIHSVTISSGGWPSIIESVDLHQTDFDVVSFFTEIEEGEKIPNARPIQSFIPGSKLIPANSSKTIDLNTFEGELGIKYVVIKLKSKKLTASKYGPNAEGFSISNISFLLSSNGAFVPPIYGTSSSFEGTAKGEIYGYLDIESSQQKALNLSTIAQAFSTATVTSIVVKQVDFSISNSGISRQVSHALSGSDQERKDKLNNIYSFTETVAQNQVIDISINPLSQTVSLFATNPTVNSAQVRSANGYQDTDKNNFSISAAQGRSNLFVLKTTNGIQIDSLETSPETLVTDYYIQDADSTQGEGPNASPIRQNTKLSINIRDGMVILTNQNGQPAGFPNFSQYQIPASVTSFGFINLLWNGTTPEPYGLSWQFVHINGGVRTFLGKKISYLEYMQLGANKVFIGLKVYDTDMDDDTENNILGESSRNGQLPEVSNRPTRYLCPVYSVKVKNRSKISISNPSSDLQKFDTWYINLTQGKFIKQIQIPSSYNFTNWIKEYKGKTLKCYYDTTKVKAPYSSVFGFGYYDIYDENPIIISDNEIKLRYKNLHAVQEQYDKLVDAQRSGEEYTDASPIVPWIRVYVKSFNKKWIEVPKKDIRSFDKHTGSIVFNKEIVPINEKDIKVNYTIKNSSVMLHQINGKSLDINPYNGLNVEKPLFIYIYPLRCEVNEISTFSDVQGFSNSRPVYFTDNYSIFNIDSDTYDPLALHIGTVKVNNFYNFDNVRIEDMRVRGGGISHSIDILKEYGENKSILSFSDIYSGKGFLHPNGGYVIVRITKEVIKNFNSIEEVYNIVRNNLTAGVSFDIQDVDGTDWKSVTDVE